MRFAYARDLMLPQNLGTDPTYALLLRVRLTKLTNPPQLSGSMPVKALVPRSRCLRASRLFEVPQSGGNVPFRLHPAHVSCCRWFKPGSCTAGGRVPFIIVKPLMGLGAYVRLVR